MTDRIIYTKEELRRIFGGEPTCPECGVRGSHAHHEEGCRVAKYIAQIHLWKQAQ